MSKPQVPLKAAKQLQVVIDRTVYVLEPYCPNPLWWQKLGLGGEHVVVEIDGVRLHTNSMWYKRPANDDEPDTAKLIERTGTGSICRCHGPFINLGEAA